MVYSVVRPPIITTTCVGQPLDHTKQEAHSLRHAQNFTGSALNRHPITATPVQDHRNATCKLTATEGNYIRLDTHDQGALNVLRLRDGQLERIFQLSTRYQSGLTGLRTKFGHILLGDDLHRFRRTSMRSNHVSNHIQNIGAAARSLAWRKI